MASHATGKNTVEYTIVHGAFSSEVSSTAGFGATKKRIKNKVYVYAEQRSEDTVAVQFINENNVPSGPLKEVGFEDFIATYVPEPEFYHQSVFPALRDLGKTIAKAERYRRNGKLYSSEMEYKNALRVDEENIRATFGLGLVYLEREDKDMADMVFRRLSHLEASFSVEHKHLFNEFGIKLRKSHMFEQALMFYSRALELGDGDENLYYNMARASFENGEVDPACEFLKDALEINPCFEEAIQFQHFLNKKVKS